MLKDGVAHGKSFIHDQDLRHGADRRGKSETNVHAARVSLNGLVNEIADLREAFDLGQHRRSFSPRKTHQRRVHADIFQTSKLGIESGAEFQWCGDAAELPGATLTRL